MPREKIEVKLVGDSHFGKDGQKVALSLEPSDVHDPSELSTYLAGYKPFPFRADEISAPIPVDKDEGKRRDFSADDTFRRVDVKGSVDVGPIPEVDPNSSLTNYKVVPRVLGCFVPQVTEMNADYRVRQVSGRRVMKAILLDREIDVATLVTTNTNWDTTVRTALGATANWNGGADSDPIADLHLMAEKSSQPVTEYWMNQKLGNTFVRHDKVKDHMRQFFGDGSPTAIASAIQNADKVPVDFALPGVGLIRISAAKVKNESTGAKDYVFGDQVVALTRTPGVPLDAEEIASTYTFRRRGPSGVGIETREFFVDGRGELGGTMVVISMADIAQITANDAGGILTGAYT